MGLDLKNIAPEARAALIKDGERFSSEDTLDQAKLTLSGYATHGAKLAAFGFAQEDAGELKDACDALIDAGVGRESKRTSKKIDTAAYAAAMRDGQAVRLRARSVLSGARRVLVRDGKAEAVQKVDALLERESVASDDAEGLAKQLDTLRGLLEVADVQAATKTRGGPEAAGDLHAQAKALRDASQAKAGPRGTPVETETLDLIDGIIVSLVRSAREAAEAAARELGEPAVATAFELSALYKRRGKKKGEKGAGEP
jgi:hypothetical protein